MEAILLPRGPTAAGHDAGPETIRWHLNHHHGIQVSRASISRYLSRAGLGETQPNRVNRSWLAWLARCSRLGLTWTAGCR